MIKDSNYLKINEYYNKFNENMRLKRRHGLVEFVTTLSYILKGLNSDTQAIDIGSGTGLYSFYLGRLGIDVDSIEYSKANYVKLAQNLKLYDNYSYDKIFNEDKLKLIDNKLLNRKICNKSLPIKRLLKSNSLNNITKGKVNIYNLDARNLKGLPSNNYDLILCLGPFYHLSGPSNIDKVFKELRRIAKKDARIFVTYMLNDYAVLYHGFVENYFLKLKNKIDSKFHIINDSSDLYTYYKIDEIDKLHKQYRFKTINRFSSEGLSDYLRKSLNSMEDETFDNYLDYVYFNSNDESKIGSGTHIVYELKKY